jgi:hypothetical protein
MYKKILSVVLISIQCFVININGQNRQEQNRREPCPDEIEWKGKYRNYSYGFSIVIPAGRKGYWNSAKCVEDEKERCICMSDHGRIIPLSENRDDYIEAYAGYALGEDFSFPNYEKQQINYLTEQKGVYSVKLLKSKSMRLSNLKARRFVISFIEDNQTKIMDRVIAYSFSRNIEYSLILNTFENNYKQHSLEFDFLINSWKLTPTN